MPCINGYTQDAEESEISLRQTIESNKHRIRYLEACLCAIISELESRGLANDVILDAENNGGALGIRLFWEEHSKSDVARISQNFTKQFSKQEQKLLKKLIKDNKI
jgi:hypothetical protein